MVVEILIKHNRNITQRNQTIKMSISNMCFVIMSYSNNPTLQDFYYEAVKPVVEGLGMKCERVDEQEFNGSIKERIIYNLNNSKIVIADLTEARPNCYYELGLAHALNKKVIHISHKKDDIHFDVRDFNFIVYSRIGELKERLSKRIKATLEETRKIVWITPNNSYDKSTESSVLKNITDVEIVEHISIQDSWPPRISVTEVDAVLFSYQESSTSESEVRRLIEWMSNKNLLIVFSQNQINSLEFKILSEQANKKISNMPDTLTRILSDFSRTFY